MTARPGSPLPTMAGPPPGPCSSTRRERSPTSWPSATGPPAPAARETWSTPVTGYGEFEGLRLPTRGKAIYKLPDADLEYINVTSPNSTMTPARLTRPPLRRRRERLMKVLVCVASKCGTTAEIARAAADVLAERLRGHDDPSAGGGCDRGVRHRAAGQRGLHGPLDETRASWSVGARARSMLVSVPAATVRVSVNGTEQAMAGRVAELEVVGPW